MVFSSGNKKSRTHPGSVYPPTDEEYIRELAAHVKEISEPFGGEKILKAKFDRYSRAAKLLDKARPVLLEKHPYQWVSMDENGELMMADSQEELVAAMKAKGLYSGDFPFAFLNPKPRRWTF